MKDVTLACADAYCRSLTASHYENFVVAAPFLPARVRRDLARIYAFCRTTDDFGDESRTPAEALERLDRWEADTRALFEGRTPVHPVLYALGETARSHALDARLFYDLIEANKMDQRVTRYARWPELQAYCRLSAAPVGRMVLAIFGVTDPRAPQRSDDGCGGLQLANHAQDVKRDESIGRRYLLDEDGATPQAVRALVERARTLLDSGRSLEPMAPLGLRLQLALYRLGGNAVCGAIERIGYRTDLARPVVGAREKLAIAMRVIAGSLYARGSGGYVGSA